MAQVLATWACLAAMLIGLGAGILHLLGWQTILERPLLATFWIGFSVLLAFLQIWHFVAPINAWPWTVASILAFPGLWIFRNTLRETFAALRQTPITTALLALAMLYVANRSIGPSLAFDSGYYNIPAVNWFVTYPVVPGLGNLHDRLAFNNSTLLFDAMLNHGPWESRASHLANGLLLAALFAQIISSVRRCLDRKGPSQPADFFDMVLFIPAFHLATDTQYLNIASITTDPPISIMMLVAASQLVRLFSAAGSRRAFLGFFILVLLAAAVTVKLSSLVYAVFAVAAIVPAILWRLDRVTDIRRALFGAAALGFLLLAPWMLRGVILSGYPMYPSTFAGLNVDWRVPPAAAEFQQNFILQFGRTCFLPDASMTQPAVGAAWILPWLKALPVYAKAEVIIPAALALLGALLWLTQKRRQNDLAWLCIIPPIAALVFWFLQAPTPRFGFALFWIAAATALAFAAARWNNQRARVALLCALLFLAVGLVAGRAWGLRHQSRDAAIAVLFNRPGPDHGFWPLPVARLTEFRTRSGLLMHKPIDDGRSWNAPLLTTPWPDENLELRVPEHPESGFRAKTRTNGITG